MSNEIVVREQSQQQPVSVSFFDLQGFELMQRVAKGFSQSTLVPKSYQGNLPNCMVALNLARRIGADPLMVMQNLDLIHGNPSWRSQFLIASVNTCGRFTPLTYQWSGTEGEDDWGCTAVATSKVTGEVLEGTTITIKMAKEEGWYHRQGSKWKTMPKQMLLYRAAAFWTRAYAPELSLGLLTQEESHDIVDLAPDDGGTYKILDRRRPTVAPEPPFSISNALDDFAQPEATMRPESPNASTEDSEPLQESVGQSPAAPADSIQYAYELGREQALKGLARDYPRGSNYHYKSKTAEGEAFLRGYDEVAADRGQTVMS